MSSAPLAGLLVVALGRDPALAYGSRLLSLLGAHIRRADAVAVGGSGRSEAAPEDLRRLPAVGALDATASTWRPDYPVVKLRRSPHELVDWANSGAMALTGARAGPPMAPPGQQAAKMRGAVAACRLLARLMGGHIDADGPELLSMRAALTGGRARSPRSVGGSCRFVPASDGWLAVNLPRAADWELVPAWLRGDISSTRPWQSMARGLAQRPAEEAAVAARELGLAVAAVVSPSGARRDEQAVARGEFGRPVPFLLDGRTPRHDAPRRAVSGPWRGRPAPWTPVVVDLTSLWAGPLCGALLGQAGCRVVKVESSRRPDGARFGDPRFFDALNGGKETVALDLARVEGRNSLTRLLARADLVLEGSRPRAMEALGVDPGALVAAGGSWLSITAYGRTGPWRNAPGYGDDTAVAAGMGAVLRHAGEPVFCGDAYADPVTGVHAALVALAVLVGRRPTLCDLALREVVNHLLQDDGSEVLNAVPGRVAWHRGAWRAEATNGATATVAAPIAPVVAQPAGPLGADTVRVLTELGAH